MKILHSLYHISVGGIAIFAALYVTALILEPNADLQINSMLGYASGSSQAVTYGWLYAGLLVSTAMVGVVSILSIDYLYRIIAMIGAAGCLVMTLIPLFNSFRYDYCPSYYEHYVGESLTCVSAGLLIVTATLLMRSRIAAEQDGAGQPATAPQSKSKGNKNTKQESKGRSQ